jgi:hypothetical protein
LAKKSAFFAQTAATFCKILAKKSTFFAQTAATFCKILIITLVFEKNANFLLKIDKNSRKL